MTQAQWTEGKTRNRQKKKEKEKNWKIEDKFRKPFKVYQLATIKDLTFFIRHNVPKRTWEKTTGTDLEEEGA
jgi:hypothetical protein